MPDRPRILVAGRLDGPAEDALAARARPVHVDVEDTDSVMKAIPGCVALIARTNLPITREILEAGAAGELKAVGIAGVGLDQVDLDAAREFGIEVLHRPEASSDAVAEFAVALMLQLLRPIPRLALHYAQGRFAEARRGAHGSELRELTVGVIGAGRIGSRVARICAAGFGARVLYNDIIDVGPFDFPAESASKDDLLIQADILTLHTPLNDSTRKMIDANVLKKLKRSTWLINTARGAIVDTDALRAALQSRQLAGAALDVIHPEPLPAGDPLFDMPNVIVTPHVAARTHGGLRRMFSIAEAVLDHL